MTDAANMDLETRLVGNWKCCDGFSDITFHISIVNDSYQVVVSDAEEVEASPEVHATNYRPSNRTLDFAVHWPSSGRFTKYSVSPSLVAGRVEVTFVYTGMELWEYAI